MTPGIYTGISAKDYHTLPKEIVSNSYLSRLNKCPAAAHVPIEDTPTLIFGRAVHSYVLEGPEAFFQEFAVPPVCDRRTTVGKQLWAEFQSANEGKTLIAEEDFVTITEINDSVRNHPTAGLWLSNGVSEQTAIWQDEETGIMCKCRLDRNPLNGVLLDLKTTEDASEYAFARSVQNYGYARQGAFYTEGVSKATGEKHDAFAFIAVEKKAPYRCEVYVLAPEYLSWGWTQVHRLLRTEKECRDKNHWPNYQVAGAQDLLLPGYL